MVVIENDGEVELGALTLLGASTKDGDSTKIGFFGSGNKYAMATLLRNGIAFEIWSGLKKIEVTTDKVSLKGQGYDRIVLDGNATSLTTRMGPDWEIWFALREFICNAKDEGGYKLTDVLTPEEGKTKIQIADDREEIREMICNIDKYILETTPIESVQTQGGVVDIIVNRSPGKEFNVYRKGISVTGKTPLKSLFWYNMENLSISEARTYKDLSEVRYHITRALLACTDKDVLDTYVQNCMNREYIESDLNFGYVWQSPSEVWGEVLKGKYCSTEKFRDFLPIEDKAHVTFLPDELAKTIHAHFEEIAFVGEKSKAGFVEAKDIPAGFEDKVNNSIAFLEKQGIDLKSKILYGKFSQAHIIAMYAVSENAIYLSIDHSMDSEDEIASTILEEVLHSKGYMDGTRYMEQYLMGKLIEAWHAKDRTFDKIREFINEAM